MTQSHWWISSIAFTVIVNTIVLKLFLETNFWNWLSSGSGAFVIIFYLGTVFLLNTKPVSNSLQPELQNEYFLIFQSAKAWIVMFILPIVVLIPDLTVLFIQKVFYPTPTDAVMRIQSRCPHYLYDGFNSVFIPQLPDDKKDEET
jgi:hypothetical protein